MSNMFGFICKKSVGKIIMGLERPYKQGNLSRTQYNARQVIDLARAHGVVRRNATESLLALRLYSENPSQWK